MKPHQEYPPSPQHYVSDINIVATSPLIHGQQKPSPRATSTAASGVLLPPHMTNPLQGNTEQQQPRFYQAPAGPSMPHLDQLPPPSADPRPPHLKQRMEPRHIHDGAPPPAAARPNGMPGHMQPRPFPQQRFNAIHQQQHIQQRHQQKNDYLVAGAHQQQVASYPPQGAPRALGKPQSAPQSSVGSLARTRMPQAVGSEPTYQNQMQYASGGNSAPSAAAAVAPPLNVVATGNASQLNSLNVPQGAAWYHGTPPALHMQAQRSPQGHFAIQQQQQQPQQQQQQQQRPFEADAQQQQQPAAYGVASISQPHVVQPPKSQQPQSQQQQQYPPPPAQQYQQRHYPQQQQRPSLPPQLDEDDDGGQVRQVPSASGQAPLPSIASGPGPSASPHPASEAPKYPPPPPHVKLKPATIDVTATPVSFVQLVQQAGGIQVDQSGTVRVVPVEAAGPPSQPILPLPSPKQQNTAAAYGPLPTPFSAPEPHPPQVHRFGSTGASSPAAAAAAPAAPLITTKEAAPVRNVYELQSYQQPSGTGVGGGPASWDDATVFRDAVMYPLPPWPPPPHAPLMDAGAGRMYLVAAAEQARSQPLQPPPVPLQHKPSYTYEEALPGPPGRLAGGIGVVERLAGQGPAPEHDGMAADGYTVNLGVQTGQHDRLGLGLRSDAAAASDAHGRQRMGDGARASHAVRQPVVAALPAPAVDEPPLPLIEAIKRAEALLAAVAATRSDGELMLGMQPQLAQTCEKRLNDLSLALKAAAADAKAARAEADAAAAAVKKAEADAGGIAAAEGEDDLGQARAGHYAFLIERSIRAVWPLETSEHQLFRTVAETLLLETEGGRCVPVNNEEVRLRVHEMVGATLCNVPAVQEKVAEIKAVGGGSTMTLLRQEAVHLEVKEHISKQDPKSLQWLVRLRVERLPSYGDLRRMLCAAIDKLMPAVPSKPEPLQPLQQQQQRRSGTTRIAGGSPGRGRGASPALEIVGREPETAEERSTLRHIALHLLGCRSREIGLFTDNIEAAAEALPPHLAKLFGNTRLQELKQLLKTHPFFWVTPKSMYGADGITCTTHECVALHTQTLLEFQYRAKLVLQQEQQLMHPSKKRKLAGGGGGDEADSGSLEQWWMDLRSRRPKLRAG